MATNLELPPLTIRMTAKGLHRGDVAKVRRELRAMAARRMLNVGVDLLRRAVHHAPILTGFLRRSGYVYLNGKRMSTSNHGQPELVGLPANNAHFLAENKGVVGLTSIPPVSVRVIASPRIPLSVSRIEVVVGFAALYAGARHRSGRPGPVSRRAGPHVGPQYISRPLAEMKGRYIRYISTGVGTLKV